MAAPSTPSPSQELADGPVLTLINKRIRALRKKLNRINQVEDSVTAGKILNKEQEDMLRSKNSVAALIDELEKLRQPLSSAVSEEINTAIERHKAESVEDLINLLYFGSLFDVKQPSEFASIMLSRAVERENCLSYDYVADDVAEILGERDFDLISSLRGLLISRPMNSSLSHKNALDRCFEHAKLWLDKSDQPIGIDPSVTYEGLRGRLKKIMASEYFTTTAEMMPGMEAVVEQASAAGNNASFQVHSHASVVPGQAESSVIHEQEVDESLNYQGQEAGENLSTADDVNKDELVVNNQSEVASSEQIQSQDEVDRNQTDVDTKEQQRYPRRTYPNQRSGRGGGGGGRRNHPNGRGGRNGGRGGGPYQNGRSQYYDQSANYQPRNYGNSRGRPGRGGGGYNNHGGGGVQAGYSAGSGEVGLAS